MTPLRVPDVGCGNGRFGAYLFTARSELHYVGIDASSALLEKARQRGAPGLDAQYKEADLIEVDLAAAVDGERFDLVVYFGLLHHLPGLARRRRLLQTGAGLLAAGGILAFTCWQFKSFERFQQRILPSDEFSDEAIGPVHPGQLEPGDHLLPWAAGGSVPYRHLANHARTLTPPRPVPAPTHLCPSFWQRAAERPPAAMNSRILCLPERR